MEIYQWLKEVDDQIKLIARGGTGRASGRICDRTHAVCVVSSIQGARRGDGHQLRRGPECD